MIDKRSKGKMSMCHSFQKLRCFIECVPREQEKEMSDVWTGYWSWIYDEASCFLGHWLRPVSTTPVSRDNTTNVASTEYIVHRPGVTQSTPTSQNSLGKSIGLKSAQEAGILRDQA